MKDSLLKHVAALDQYNDLDLWEVIKGNKMDIESGAGSIQDSNLPIDPEDFDGTSGGRTAMLGNEDLSDIAVILEYLRT